MRKLTLLLCLLISYAVFAQQDMSLGTAQQSFAQEQDSLNKKCPKCGCTKLPPWTLITAATAQRRFDSFAVKKTRTGQIHLDDGILYSIKGMQALLDIVTVRKPKKYDGFRTYFATFPEENSPDSGYQFVPKDQFGKLTLVFVPTNGNPKRWRSHPDDTLHYMIVDGDVVKTVPKSIVALWVNKAQQGILAKFDADGKRHRKSKWPVYRETHSLWYSRRVLVSNWTHNGLIDILKCHDCCGDTKYIYAGYGAFLTGLRRNYQLTLVFKLSNGKASSYLSLFYLDAPANGSDTGNPCPPPSKCSTIGDGVSQEQYSRSK